MMRIGQMIKITPEGLQAYKDYHANPLPGVNEMIKECNIQNYSIYHRGDYLFSYFEYVGNDYEADMAKMAADPTTQKWWDLVKPLMEPLPIKWKASSGQIWKRFTIWIKMLFYLLHIFSIKRTDFTQILCGLQEGGRSVFFAENTIRSLVI